MLCLASASACPPISTNASALFVSMEADGELHPMHRVGADNPNQRHDHVGEKSEGENEKGGISQKEPQEFELGRRN